MNKNELYCIVCGHHLGAVEGMDCNGIYVYCETSSCKKQQPVTFTPLYEREQVKKAKE